MCDSEYTKSLLKQIWTSSGVLLSIIGQGMLLGYMSVLLPALREPGSEVQADLHDTSWIASSASAAVILGFLLSSILMDVLGRKLAYILLILPGPVGLLLIYTASSVPSVLTGRMLGGVTAGGTIMLGAVVIGEYTSPEHRGMFLNLKTAAVSLGSTISHLLGFYFHWRTISLIILIPYVISFGIVCTWVESPAWLALKGKTILSEQNFYWLRGRNYQTKLEFDEMITAQSQRLSKAKKSSYKAAFRKLTKRTFLRPIFIMFTSTLLLEMSGRHIFPTYASDIIAEMGGRKENLVYSTLFLDVIITLSTIFSSFLTRIMKTRTLLFSTGSASLVILLTTSAYLFLSSNHIISNEQTWITTTLFTVYFILANLGCTPIPLALTGEIFPLAHKGTGLLISGILSCLCVGVTLKCFPFLLASIKLYGTLASLGMVQTMTLLILYFILPETKNKTLQEIEDNMQYGRVGYDKSIPDHDDERDKMLS